MIRFLSLVLLASVGVMPIAAQELRYEDGFQIEYDNPTRYLMEGPVVYNGRDYGCFFSSKGPDDADFNLYFRRLDRDGKPLGPQVRITDGAGEDVAVVAAWDGQAYIIFYTYAEDRGAKLVRVDAAGLVLGGATIPGDHSLWLFDMKGSAGWANHQIDVVDDMVNLFFTSGTSTAKGATWLARVKKDLSGSVNLLELPKGDLKGAGLAGVGFDLDGYLLGLVELGASDNVVKKTRFLRVGYDGLVQGAPLASPVDLDNCQSMIGPIYNGKGFLILYNQYVTAAPRNRTVVIDRNLQPLSAPHELGENGSPFFYLHAAWAGYGVHALTAAYHITAEGSLFFNSEGRFLADPVWHKDDFYSVSIRPFHAFGGTQSTIVYLIYSASYKGHHFLANQVNLPENLLAPKVYQLASATENYKSGKRMVCWSTAGGGSVTLKGKGFTYKNLPPVGHMAVPMTVAKQRLRLTVSGPGGTAKKKIVLTS
jgi:hypothetical protein